MQMYKNYISPLGYQMGDNRIDSYGVNHSGFNLQDTLYYNLARNKRENALIDQYKSQGITKNYPQYGTNFWGVPASNNYGFGNSNIVGTVEPMLKNPLINPPLNQPVQYAQNNLLNMANGMNQTSKKIDYSLYGNDFSKEFIDEMENDKEFKQILNEYIIPNEGGYNNDLYDSGGETNMGIARNAHQNEDIKNLTRERANAIYYRDYYKWNGLNKLPYSVRGFVVDYGLPTYPLNTIRTVHKVLNLPPKGSIIGSDTLNKFRNFSKQDYEDFLENFRTEMKKHFYESAQNNPNNRKFLKGWLNRADRAHLAK